MAKSLWGPSTEHYPGFREQQFAHKNFFYPSVNEDSPMVTAANQCPYRVAPDARSTAMAGVSEPWLCDRTSTFFLLYLRSGSWKALREAVRAADRYRQNLYPPGTVPDSAVGAFRYKNPVPGAYIGANGIMYSYNEPLAYALWLTGDQLMSDPIKWVAKGPATPTVTSRSGSLPTPSRTRSSEPCPTRPAAPPTSSG